MKTIIAAATLALTATYATAEGFNIDMTPRTYLELSTETKDLEFNAGVDLDYSKFTLSADYYANKPNGDSFSFTGVELGAKYSLNESASIYAVAGFDSDLEYSDTVVGVALSF